MNKKIYPTISTREDLINESIELKKMYRELKINNLRLSETNADLQAENKSLKKQPEGMKKLPIEEEIVEVLKTNILLIMTGFYPRDDDALNKFIKKIASEILGGK